jgi:hypothetical protein
MIRFLNSSKWARSGMDCVSCQHKGRGVSHVKPRTLETEAHMCAPLSKAVVLIDGYGHRSGMANGAGCSRHHQSDLRFGGLTF